MSDPNPFEGMTPPPAAILLGHRFIAFDRAAQTLRLGFEGKREFLNPMGIVQGGMLSAMIDDTMGPLLIALGKGRMGTTIDLGVSFLRAVKPGPIEVEARIVRQGRNVAFLEGELFDAEGKLSVRATASFFMIGGDKG